MAIVKYGRFYDGDDDDDGWIDDVWIDDVWTADGWVDGRRDGPMG